MAGIKSRIYEGIVQQDEKDKGTAIIDLALILQLPRAAHLLGNAH
jgi:hypothetical protein